MVAIVRLEIYEKLVYMRHFSEKTTGRRTGGIAIQTAIGCKGKSLYFSDLPNKAFYRLNDIHVLPSVLKVTQGQYLAIQGILKVVY